MARLPAPAGTEAHRTYAGFHEMSAGIVAFFKPQVESLPLRVCAECARRQILDPLDLFQESDVDDDLFAATDQPMTLVVGVCLEPVWPRFLLPNVFADGDPAGDHVGAGEDHGLAGRSFKHDGRRRGSAAGGIDPLAVDALVDHGRVARQQLGGGL